MVVLQLGPYPPPHGGVQTNLVAIREYLRHHQVSAPVINLTRHRRPESDEVYYPRTALGVVWLLLTVPADVIHVHIGGQLTARLLALCAICALIPGRRVVLSLHSGGYPSGAGRNVGAASLTGFVLRRLDALIAVNEEIAQLFRRLGVSPARISVICPYTPVMVRRDTPLPEGIRRFVDSHSPVVTTVGLLEPEYDLTLQIRTLTKIRQRHPQAGLVIVGSGSLESQLRRQIDAEPDGKHVLLCGDVSHAHTVRLLHESDLVLRTTLYDGDSVSVREALQLGVPVIASDNGMRPAGVHLIPVADAVALEQAVDRVLRAPRLAPAPSMAAEGDLEAIRALYSALVGREVGVRRPPLASVP